MDPASHERSPALCDGHEAVTSSGHPTGVTLLDFWRWSTSTLLDNATRGILAEFLVGTALGCLGDTPRIEWDAYDLRSSEGIAVEVKSAAYLQSWRQVRPSRISFGIKPTYGWNARTDSYSPDPRRQADVYVFCLLDHHDRHTANPLDTDQWVFYVCSAHRLDDTLGSQETITLSSLLHTIGPSRATFSEVAETVRRAAR